VTAYGTNVLSMRGPMSVATAVFGLMLYRSPAVPPVVPRRTSCASAPVRLESKQRPAKRILRIRLIRTPRARLPGLNSKGQDESGKSRGGSAVATDRGFSFWRPGYKKTALTRQSAQFRKIDDEFNCGDGVAARSFRTSQEHSGRA